MCGNFGSEVSAQVLGGKVSRNGKRGLPPKFVGRVDLGGSLALLGSDGQCVLAHRVECARKVRAARRALFPPDSEGAGDGARQRDLQPFHQF